MSRSSRIRNRAWCPARPQSPLDPRSRCRPSRLRCRSRDVTWASRSSTTTRIRARSRRMPMSLADRFVALLMRSLVVAPLASCATPAPCPCTAAGGDAVAPAASANGSSATLATPPGNLGMLLREREAMARTKTARRKMGKKDGPGCLADLDAHDQLDRRPEHRVHRSRFVLRVDACDLPLRLGPVRRRPQARERVLRQHARGFDGTRRRGQRGRRDGHDELPEQGRVTA